jgi:hypothetical protein
MQVDPFSARERHLVSSMQRKEMVATLYLTTMEMTDGGYNKNSWCDDWCNIVAGRLEMAYSLKRIYKSTLMLKGVGPECTDQVSRAND